MKGKNKILKQVHNDNGLDLNVFAIWHTLQGEGPWQGRPAMFIRLHGCNLKCWFCDTDFESENSVLSIKQIAEQLEFYNRPHKRTPYVVITGGEPMRQNLVPLIYLLNSQGYKVQIETAGTLYPREDPENNYNNYGGRFYSLFVDNCPDNVVVCSPKTPTLSSSLMETCGNYKYVIRAGEVSEEDGLPIMSTQIQGKPAKLARPPKGAQVWVMPMDEQDEEKNKANMAQTTLSALKFGYRLTLQTHKIIGVE